MAMTTDVIGVEIDLTIEAGRNLVPKDGSGFLGLGKKKSSDPYGALSPHCRRTHQYSAHCETIARG